MAKGSVRCLCTICATPSPADCVRPAYRPALLGHAPHAMSGHYASADVGPLLELAIRVLKREETRTKLRVVNG